MRAGRRDIAGLLFAAGLAVTVILVAIFSNALDGSRVRHEQPLTSLGHAFHIFRSAPEALPLNVVGRVRHSGSSKDLADVQRLPGTHAAEWAFADDKLLCLLSLESRGGLASSCTLIRRAVRRGVFLTLLLKARGRLRRRTVGLAPDGVTEVELRTPGFPSRTVSVDGNVFQVDDGIPEPPEEIGLLR